VVVSICKAVVFVLAAVVLLLLFLLVATEHVRRNGASERTQGAVVAKLVAEVRASQTT
jgi:hypothetical protein